MHKLLQKEYERKGSDAKEWWRTHKENLANQELDDAALRAVVMAVIHNMTLIPIFRERRGVFGSSMKNRQKRELLGRIERVSMQSNTFIAVAADMLEMDSGNLRKLLIDQINEVIRRVDE